jgi:hypothetical protein
MSIFLSTMSVIATRGLGIGVRSTLRRGKKHGGPKQQRMGDQGRMGHEVRSEAGEKGLIRNETEYESYAKLNYGGGDRRSGGMDCGKRPGADTNDSVGPLPAGGCWHLF